MEQRLIGKRYRVDVLGCRTNLYESEAIASAFERAGAVRCADGEADVEVVVTCTITGTADAKSRKAVRRMRARSPRAVVVACGCWAQCAGADEAEALGADIVVGNRRKSEIVALTAELIAERERGEDRSVARIDDISRSDRWDALELDRPTAHTRAFIKMQDGCSRSCSYCAVPTARGRSVSRGEDDLLGEIGRVVSSGCVEIVLTGVHLGSWRGEGRSLAQMIGAIGEIDGVRRIRLGSIEPFSVTDEMLAALADCEKFCRHLHIPFQSGDDAILAAMRRGTTRRDLEELARRARRWLGDDLHISTDMMVGFPGESDAAFENSLSLAREAGIGRIHLFPYSAREGTDAAAMPCAVPEAVKHERITRAQTVAAELLERYASRFVGVDCDILVERVEGDAAIGWTRNYVRAYAPIGPDGGSQKNIVGREITFAPKSSVGAILCGHGIDPRDITDLSDG